MDVFWPKWKGPYRGIEGEAARSYFSVFNQLIFIPGEEFHFNDRNRRPPLDHVNCLLSFFYTLVMHDIRSVAPHAGAWIETKFLQVSMR
ncbi:MAG: CRISPR-associated endonuclease Cas1 [Candidatus Omnitrophica bacterium]|nr:CRISPR-associated endonuclease Cas1 [Candidatus Omnitrophota bacterium]